jgi:hypothetical protein
VVIIVAHFDAFSQQLDVRILRKCGQEDEDSKRRKAHCTENPYIDSDEQMR